MSTLTSARQLVAELTPTGRRVDSYVMGRHEAIARVLNPPRSADGDPLTWASFARDEFVPASDLQWRDLVDGLRPEGTKPPQTGTVDPLVASALLGLLPTPDSGEIFVAQWVGYADAEQPASAQALTFPPGDRQSLVWSVQTEVVPLLARVPMRW